MAAKQAEARFLAAGVKSGQARDRGGREAGVPSCAIMRLLLLP